MPNAAKIAKTTEAWMGSDKVLIPDGDGSAHPSDPTPCITTGSGSGTACLLKNEMDDFCKATGFFPKATLGDENATTF